MIALRSPVGLAGMAMIVLPFALLSGGLTMTSATDVVIFAIACMALNVLVGHTGLVSFGHGAWFGLGAYAAALAQRHWFPGSMLWPTLFALAFLAVAGIIVGFFVLRRRGVYFSLLTLAFSALTYAIAFRWTAFTGGENGLGGVTRANWLGVDLENRWVYYTLVALVGLALGALFYILFREYLSIWTPHWLWFFGLLFVGFIVFSPTGLTGVWRRLTEPMRPKVVEVAAMAGRAIEQNVPLPAFLAPRTH